MIVAIDCENVDAKRKNNGTPLKVWDTRSCKGHESMCSILNSGSDSVDLATSSLKSLDSSSPRSAVFVRPSEEVLQIVADVVDRVQIKSAIGAKNSLFNVL